MTEHPSHVANGIIEVIHTTRYDYPDPVRLSINEARLHPLSDAWQTCLDAELVVEPAGAVPRPVPRLLRHPGRAVRRRDIAHRRSRSPAGQRFPASRRPTADEVDGRAGAHQDGPVRPLHRVHPGRRPMVHWDDEVEALAHSLAAGHRGGDRAARSTTS